jgi:hypothetical protein
MKRCVLLLIALGLAPACLVIGLNPAYDGETIAWDPALLGHWDDPEDKSSLDIERGEWRSYRIKYAHPSESGNLTGYLTSIGDARFLDIMPARGADHGSFLIPVHALLRIDLNGDRLTLTPLSYDWLSKQVRSRSALSGLDIVFDQKQNAVIVSSTTDLRAWLRKQSKEEVVFGAGAVFARKEARADAQRHKASGRQENPAREYSRPDLARRVLRRSRRSRRAGKPRARGPGSGAARARTGRCSRFALHAGCRHANHQARVIP